MGLVIKALSPALAEDYFDFFDHRAFSDGSPYYPCYCNDFNLSAEQIKSELYPRAEALGGGLDGWKRALRESAVQMVSSGIIQGYLVFDGTLAVGWCNANDRMNYYRVGEFELMNAPADEAPDDCPGKGIVKSIVCFEIAPEYRGKGIAAKLLEHVCRDAKQDGYKFAEVYPTEQERGVLAFTGPIHLYQKAGFQEFSRRGTTVVMRKPLQE